MSFFRLSIFRLLEGETQHATLLFSPLSAASCARAHYGFSAEIHPFPPSLARQVALVRKMRTAHFRGNGVENIDFQRLYQTIYERGLTRSAATHDERAAVSSCISRALSSRSGLRVHFAFLPRQKHFTFARKLRSHIARFYPRKNFTSEAARHAVAY